MRANHLKGFVKMKEAMWRVNPVGSYRFSDSTNPDQQILFNHEDSWLPTAMDQIRSRFTGEDAVDAKEVHDYIEEHTAFTKPQSISALNKLELDMHIAVYPTKKDGKKRHGKSFPEGVLIDFR